MYIVQGHNATVYGRNLHDATMDALKVLNASPVIGCENQDNADKSKDVSITINVEDISKPTISKAFPGELKTMVEYVLEFVNGVKDFEVDLGKWDYTYHQEIKEYLDKCINELKRNHDTRRAVIPIAGEKSYASMYPPCMQNIMFRIIGGKLHTTVTFRSNDAVKAFVMNSFAISQLARFIATEVGVEVGGYTHIANSFHAYSNDWDQLEGYCKMFATRDESELYYTYEEYLEVYNEYANEYKDKCFKRYCETHPDEIDYKDVLITSELLKLAGMCGLKVHILNELDNHREDE